MTKLTGSRILAATPLIAGFAILAFSLGTGAASAEGFEPGFEPRSGQLHIVKDCMAPGV
jgi:hypothetical protein